VRPSSKRSSVLTAACGQRRTIAAALAIVAIVAVALPHAAFAGTSDTDQIRQVVYDSQVAQQRLDLPANPQPAGEGLAPAVIGDMQSRIATQLPQYYAGQRLQEVTSVMQQHAAAQANGTITEQDGGVDSISFDLVTVQGQSAVATGQVVKWLKLAWKAQSGKISVAEPRGPVNFVDHLTNTSDGWRIVSESLTFPTGTGP
jgi:hypothetical protein